MILNSDEFDAELKKVMDLGYQLRLNVY